MRPLVVEQIKAGVAGFALLLLTVYAVGKSIQHDCEGQPHFIHAVHIEENKDERGKVYRF